MLLIPKQPESRTFDFFLFCLVFSLCEATFVPTGNFFTFRRFHPKKAKIEGQELNLDFVSGEKDCRDTDEIWERKHKIAGEITPGENCAEPRKKGMKRSLMSK